MLKPEIRTFKALSEWMDKPVAAVFIRLDLTEVGAALRLMPLHGCVFIACTLCPDGFEAAQGAGCVILPRIDGLPFDPFREGVYTAAELYEGFDPDDPEVSYALTPDRRIYLSYADYNTNRPYPVGLDTHLFRRLHDSTLQDALDKLMPPPLRLRAVAIMGGHDRARNDPAYRHVAELTYALTRAGFIIMTGGGPGLMEAANLGAYAAGFEDDTTVERALTHMARLPEAAQTYHDSHAWLSGGYRVWKAMGAPVNGRGFNISVPTWYYGHEPPNVFATHIAKYFENSVREDGLLALAWGGVIFAEGNAGTVQEIFQDATQSYYSIFEGLQSPMVLMGRAFWDPDSVPPAQRPAAAKPAWPLLKALATKGRFDDRIALKDDIADIIAFLQAHPPRRRLSEDPSHNSKPNGLG